MKYKKTLDDFQRNLQTQIRFLNDSCASYDKGFEDEAIRIAVCLRVLLHDTRDSTSLLNHLNLKENMLFLNSSSHYMPNNLLSYSGLASMQLKNNEGAKYIYEKVDSSPNWKVWMKFDLWWNLIVIDDKKNLFSRKNLITHASNEEGGAHVDPELTEKYAELIKSNSMGWTYGIGDKVDRPFDNNPIFPSIRRIAEEILISLNVNNGKTKIINYEKTNDLFKVCFINSWGYIYKYEKDNDLIKKLYEDKRVNKKENILEGYTDICILNNGNRIPRYIIW